MRHERDIFARPDRARDGIGVLRQAGALIGVGQPHRDSVMAALRQLGDDAVPDPWFTAGTGE